MIIQRQSYGTPSPENPVEVQSGITRISEMLTAVSERVTTLENSGNGGEVTS